LDIIQIIKLLDDNGETVVKSVIYDLICKATDNVEYKINPNFTDDDDSISVDVELPQLQHEFKKVSTKDTLIVEFNKIKDSLNVELFAELIMNNDFVTDISIVTDLSTILFDKYKMYGYILMNNYEDKMNMIKSLSDSQFIIFFTQFYTDYIYEFIYKYYTIYSSNFLKRNNTDTSNLYDIVKKAVSDGKVYIDKCINRYNSDISLIKN
jgi:hypothetical protein